MTSQSLRHELHQLLTQLLLVVGYALGCLTVVSMFALLLTSMGGLVCRRSDRGELDLRTIGSALKLYRTKKGHYPSTKEGLRALVSAGMLEYPPRDPWNAEYHYALRRGRPLVWSLGADGVPGGEGEDGDLYSPPLPP